MEYRSLIRNWPGNPTSDLTHIMAQPHVFAALIADLAAPFVHDGITYVATVEAGGLALGGGIAHRLHAGMVLIRKASKIMWQVEVQGCIDWTGREKILELARDAVTAADRVLVVDDWSETGAQLHAGILLVERLGAAVAGAACLHIGPQARQRLAGYRLHEVIRY